jgi:hypothetical protein
MSVWNTLLGLFVLSMIILAVVSKVQNRSFNSLLSDFFSGFVEVFKIRK